jgi:hypothetical protein
MLAKGHITVTANGLLTNAGYSISDPYWKTGVMVIVVLLIGVLLIAQLGTGAGLEKGAEMALRRATQLMHEADKENRKVRPVPLSQAEIQVQGRLA